MPMPMLKLRKSCLVTLALLSLQTPIYALEPPNQPATVDFLTGGPPSVAVLEPEFHGAEASLANAFADRLRAYLFRSGAVKVGERQQLQTILKEQALQSSSYCSQSCLSALGQTLGVEYIVFSSVNQIGSLYALSIRLVRVSDGELTEVITAECRCPVDELLTNEVQRLSERLLTTLAPRRGTGSLNISSEPAGASLSIDGKAWGTTPLRLEHVPAGRYSLVLSYPGYQSSSQVLEVNARQQQSLNLKLDLRGDLGVISFESEPAGSQVIVNERLLGETPLHNQELPTGEYLIRFEKKGFKSHQDRYLIIGGPTTIRGQLLQPALPKGSLSIQTQPAEADVYLNGIWQGKTPFSQSDLPTGDYTLSLQKEGYELIEHRLRIEAGQTSRFTETLNAPSTQLWTWGLLGGLLLTSLAMGAMHRQRALAQDNASAAEGGMSITGLSF